MIFTLIYLLAIFAELLFAIGFSIFTLFLFYSSFKGSPYVPTRGKEVEVILKEAKLKPKQNFYELGCGDARIARNAVKNYRVKAVAVDVNPLLIIWAKFLAKLQKLKKIEFKTEDIFKIDLSEADVVYLFLMPKLIDQLLLKLNRELKKNTLIISHGFIIEKWDRLLVKKINHKPFPTYYYRKI